jgi:hypothetical protein
MFTAKWNWCMHLFLANSTHISCCEDLLTGCIGPVLDFPTWQCSKCSQECLHLFQCGSEFECEVQPCCECWEQVAILFVQEKAVPNWCWYQGTIQQQNILDKCQQLSLPSTTTVKSFLLVQCRRRLQNQLRDNTEGKQSVRSSKPKTNRTRVSILTKYQTIWHSSFKARTNCHDCPFIY